MSDIKTCGYHPVHGAQIFDGPSLPAGWFDSPANFPAKPVEAAAPDVTRDDGAEHLREQLTAMEEEAIVGRAEIVRLNGVVEALIAECSEKSALIEALAKEGAELSAQLEQLTAPKDEGEPEAEKSAETETAA